MFFFCMKKLNAKRSKNSIDQSTEEFKKAFYDSVSNVKRKNFYINFGGKMFLEMIVLKNDIRENKRKENEWKEIDRNICTSSMWIPINF